MFCGGKLLVPESTRTLYNAYAKVIAVLLHATERLGGKEVQLLLIIDFGTIWG
jgi:hypothetical protein